MKEFMEEYGGITAACFLGILLLQALWELLGAGGGIACLIQSFLEGIGAVCV